MGIACLILGKSGSGKSSSLRNFGADEVGVINVMGKPMPFRSQLKSVQLKDYEKIKAVLKRAEAKSIVIDDAGYLITDHFMMGHSNTGAGNAVFAFYNEIGDSFYRFVKFINEEVDGDRIVYLLMHEDKNDFGDIKPKTIGKLLDEKVCLEGMFSIVLRCYGDSEKHVFLTKSDGRDVTKTPIGMFEDREIDNCLKSVDTVIRDYYGLNAAEATAKKAS